MWARVQGGGIRGERTGYKEALRRGISDERTSWIFVLSVYESEMNVVSVTGVRGA